MRHLFLLTLTLWLVGCTSLPKEEVSKEKPSQVFIDFVPNEESEEPKPWEAAAQAQHAEAIKNIENLQSIYEAKENSQFNELEYGTPCGGVIKTKSKGAFTEQDVSVISDMMNQFCNQQGYGKVVLMRTRADSTYNPTYMFTSFFCKN